MPRVQISDGGRAGTVTYREGLHTASFDWEFAMSPALAVISGPKARDWDRVCPWAAGRQGEVFEHVAGEVIRQKAGGCTPEIDLAAGTITLLGPRRREKGRKRRGSSKRGALDSLGDHPRARGAVDEAVRHHLSVDVRLAAAEALHARGALADLEPVLTRELRLLNRREDGLARVLRLAEDHPTPAVKQALLWASWNQTECAADCARLLLKLVGGPEALDAMGPVLRGLEFHTSFFQRKAAFEALCQKLGMTLEPG